MTLLLILSGLVVIVFLLTAIAYWLGGRALGAGRATLVRALLLTLSIYGITVAGLLVLYLLQLGPQEQNLGTAFGVLLVMLLCQLALPLVLIAGMLHLSLPRSIVAWLIGLLPSLAAVAVMFLVLKPYVVEAYVMPTMNMAPTLLGWHKQAACPHCGGRMYVPAVAPNDPDRESIQEFAEQRPGICGECWRSGKPAQLPAAAMVPDRFFVDKLRTPERWDLLVFRYPEDPKVLYVDRLVVMPGEVAYLKDGELWVDGKKLTPPESIAKLRHPDREDAFDQRFGTPERPWRLRADEYAVLGDFSDLSSDSRSWGPVPTANILGVVTVRYWPPARWLVWR